MDKLDNPDSRITRITELLQVIRVIRLSTPSNVRLVSIEMEFAVDPERPAPKFIRSYNQSHRGERP